MDRWRSLLLAALAGAVISGSVASLRPITYTATAQAIVDSRRPTTSLSDLTAQLGLASFSTDGSPTPQFYADMLTSRTVLGAVIDSSYSFTTDGGEMGGNLIDLMKVEGPSLPLRREEAMKELRGAVSRSVTPRTGVITVSVKAPYPELAPLIVDRLIAEVNRVNVESRQSQASNERQFAARRMSEAAAELRAAEDALQSFLEQNRAARLAPRTSMQEDRLIRAVGMRQAIYTSVAQAYEQARIDEARDTPGLRVIEPPAVPLRRDPRGRARAALTGLLLGGLIMGLVIMLREYFRRIAREDPDSYSGLSRSLRTAGREAIRPWRWFRSPRKAVD